MCPPGHVGEGQESCLGSLGLMVVWLAARDASVVTFNGQLRWQMGLVSAVPPPGYESNAMNGTMTICLGVYNGLWVGRQWRSQHTGRGKGNEGGVAHRMDAMGCDGKARQGEARRG
ncbi:hypothetical protein VFPPC_17425 [Pochonia chlamydosporia 170]|uniref:Uncharacterized protein n=1 Tax=Pochonia chlamydosporia 170 TaxID=1380566 RepID=A0A219ARL8_METCM|nr:hypothetical protein VFPPC_17425 [Pochonia chlamydosporia 170]OWT43426.1 hypothetical protein VFPPC_17425 [Pochonia chlamydosporia 170]